MQRTTLAIGLLLGSTSPLTAAPIDIATSFDRAPWISARAAALSGTLSTTANGLDAYYYNPALIGGMRAKEGVPTITHLFFPYMGVSSGTDSAALNQPTLLGTAVDSDLMTEAVRPTWTGGHPYTALSATPVVIFKRVMLGYTYNHRVGSYLTSAPETSDTLHVSSKTVSGPILVFSAIAPNSDFFLGVSAGLMRSKQVEVDFDAAAFESLEARTPLVAAGTESYEGIPVNIGMLYRFSPKSRPSLSLVVNDISGTRYSPADHTKDTVITAERATLGCSISPMLKTWGMLHLTLEATDLTQSTVSVQDKLRASTEFNVGDRYGADSGLSLRLGYSVAGLSFGTGINLGILAFQVASMPEDIGAGKDHVIERRSIVNIGINIADY